MERAVENAALVVDLTKMQLLNERQCDLKELEAAVRTVQDNVGRLVVVNRMTLSSTTMVALGIKYQRHGSYLNVTAKNKQVITNNIKLHYMVKVKLY